MIADGAAWFTNSRTSLYTVASVYIWLCVRQAVWVFVASARSMLVRGLITSSQFDHQVP